MNRNLSRMQRPRLILAQIDKNMTALGWQKVNVEENPDVLINARRLVDDYCCLLVRLLVLVVWRVLSILGLGISILCIFLYYGNSADAHGRSGCNGFGWPPGNSMGGRDQWYFDVLL